MVIISHRGASGYAPENTLASMKMALEMGCEAMEFDVQLTKDNQMIVCHDFTVDRTTNGTGEVKDLTLAEIKSLDAGSWFSKEFAGERIPTLDEVLDLVPNDLLLHIEIKKTATDKRNIEKMLYDYLVRYNRLSTSLISSFNHSSVLEIKKLDNQLNIAIALEADLIEPLKYIEGNNLPIYSFHPCYDYVTADMIKQLHDHNIKVNCWTVNSKEVALSLKEMGVDSVFSNYPDLLK